MLDKTFDSSVCEKEIYNKWEKNGLFKPSKKGDSFSVVIPPPNLTGN